MQKNLGCKELFLNILLLTLSDSVYSPGKAPNLNGNL